MINFWEKRIINLGRESDQGLASHPLPTLLLGILVHHCSSSSSFFVLFLNWELALHTMTCMQNVGALRLLGECSTRCHLGM
jgi:hypothetical protein